VIREKIIVGAGTKYPLKGLLTLPDRADGPVPAVVLVHGSGSSNMDEKVGKLTPFKDLAEGLAQHGIASVRYDKRTYTHGLKMMRSKGEPITVKEETIDDAILAAELLRNDKRIDPEKVFIIGHSMGAMLAPRIDAEGGNFAGLILLAGTPRKLEEVLADQVAEQMSAMKGFARKIAEKQTEKLLKNFEGLYDLSDGEAKAKKLGGGTTLYYFKEMGEHSAQDYLLPLEKPFLIAQGEKDFQATVARDFSAYQQLLNGKPNVTFKLYKNLNHCFVPSVYGTITKAKQEYKVEQHIGQEVISDIANWILAASGSTKE